MFRLNITAALEQFRISFRISVLSALSIASTIVLSGTYLFGDMNMKQAFDSLQQHARLAQVSKNIENGTLQMRRRKKDFIIRRDLNTIAEYEEAENRVTRSLEELATMEVTAQIQEEVTHLKAGIAEHAELFKKVVKLNKQLGVNENSGLQGALREAIHAVESKLKEVGADALTVKMLMMRRHEKDFMLRGEKKYILRIEERRQEFDELLANENLPHALKQELSGLMDTYDKDFHAWAETRMLLKETEPKLSDTFARMKDDFERTFAVAEEGLVVAEASLDEARDLTETIFVTVCLAVLGIAVILGVTIGRSVSKPIQRMTQAIVALSEGDTVQEIPSTNNKDEIGDIARAVLVFKENALERDRLEAEQSKQRETQAQRAQAVESLITAFDKTVSQALGTVTSASIQLDSTAKSMTDTATQTSERSSMAAQAAESASANVGTVAASSGELNSAILEISRQMAQSANVSNQAKDEADRTCETMNALADAAQKIGAVVNLIQDIAEQTNLLALNATIEAARAGDAGKGFAVVAGEVKSLANQTAKATEEISQQITAMQNSTVDAVTAIERVNGTIEQMAEIATAISSAVEEQSAVTQEISKNVQEASAGTSQVTTNIAEVSNATGETSQAANQVKDLASDLSEQANRLGQEIGSFLTSVKTA
ncbi:methyl-accepting chemotaxis protein [Pelagibius sp. Alg239-R121]|uniref:methyl-accepting chemotaxis protein n=1 Tax=Pelagibius sp. Alg239-R121 TaxID=2993448 RepID=UPI0024A6FA8D|nr:methyl-accepting chemotaxis protein [Pelagibius sp. Alg239-R121]